MLIEAVMRCKHDHKISQAESAAAILVPDRDGLLTLPKRMETGAVFSMMTSRCPGELLSCVVVPPSCP